MSTLALGDVQKTLAEIRRRDEFALKLYRPTEKQEAFHRCTVGERIVRGGHRCLAGEQLIYDPVAKEHRRVDEIDSDFHVLSVDPNTGETIICEASQPFIKGYGELVEVTLSNGNKLKVTRQHRVISHTGEWVSIDYAFRNQVPVAVVSESSCLAGKSTIEAGQQCRRTSRQSRQWSSSSVARAVSDCQATASSLVGRLDELLFRGDALHFESRQVTRPSSWRWSWRYAASKALQALRGKSLSPVLPWLRRDSWRGLLASICAASLSLSLTGDARCSQTVQGFQCGCHHECRFCDGQLLREEGIGQSLAPSQADAREHSLYVHAGGQVGAAEHSPACPLCDHLSSCRATTVCRDACTHGRHGADRLQAESQPDGLESSGRRTSHGEVLSSEFVASHPLLFSLKDDVESLCVVQVTSLHIGDIWDIEVKATNAYIIDGVVQGNSGKSTCNFLEVAHAATKIPITCNDGSEIPYKYPSRALRIWLIGKDEDHIGDTMFTMLFKGGLFYVIDDLETGKPRIWDPNRKEDVARKSERRTSGPMIPPEYIDERGYVWVNKGKNVFSKVTLKNGTEIFAYPSGGDCPSGVPVDLLAIDEDIKYPSYVSDWQGRLIDRSGRLTWSAFPWARNDALINLSNRAAEEADNPNADIREFQLHMSENPYLDPEEKQKARDRWAASGDIELAARDRGEFPMDAVLMYPEFRKDVHGISDLYMPDSEAARILHLNGGEPPDDWMRLLALDPGSSKCAVLFACVPPPEIGNEIIIYDEVFQKNSDARKIAKEIQPRLMGKSFYRFIIDNRAARQTPLGLGKTVRSVYEKAFRGRHLSPEGGNMFHNGNDNVLYRTDLVRQRLRLDDGATTPRLLVYLPRTPRLQWEFMNYKRRISHKEYLDEPIAANNDACNCLEYLVAADIQYRRPKGNTARPPALRHSDALSRLFADDSNPGDRTAVSCGPFSTRN